MTRAKLTAPITIVVPVPATAATAPTATIVIIPIAPTATVVIIPIAPTATVVIVPIAPTTTIVIIPAAPTTTVVITQRALIHVALFTKHLRERRKLALLIFVKAIVDRPLRIIALQRHRQPALATHRRGRRRQRECAGAHLVIVDGISFIATHRRVSAECSECAGALQRQANIRSEK
jgi:hypothetical protein